jgi:hypothetical protein
MINNIEQLKELILWAKNEKVKSFKVDNVAVEISDLAFFEASASLTGLETAPKSTALPSNQALPTEEDELLYWSTNK